MIRPKSELCGSCSTLFEMISAADITPGKPWEGPEMIRSRKDYCSICFYAENEFDIAATDVLGAWGHEQRRGRLYTKRSGKERRWFFYLEPNPVRGEDIAQNFSNRFEFIDAQLRTCRQYHDCARTPGFKPPRLLEIVGSTVRLVNGEGVPRNEPYVALSYCWGPHPTHTTLTTDNISVYRIGVDISDFPKTIADSIYMVRKLNMSYIWIDGWCIIQSGPGSAADWNCHVDLMADIYEHSAMSLAIQTARDCQQQLDLSNIERTFHPSLDLRLGGEQVRLFFEPINKNLLMGHRQESASGEPLNRRGWVLQERLLSTRLVEYVKDEMIWTCSRGTATYTEPVPNKSILVDAEAMYGKGVPEDYNSWLWIIVGFTQRALTKPTDRLPALAGIAKRTATVLADEYIAGLFRSKLPLSLLWCVQAQVGNRFPRPTRIPGAPSWSWASVDATVGDYVSARPDYYIEMASVVDVTGMSSFGNIKTHSLTLKAPLIGSEAITNTYTRRGDRNRGPIHVYDVQSLGSLETTLDIPDAQASMSFCFVVIAMKKDARSSRTRDTAEGLVLERDGDVYRRVGVFEEVQHDAKRALSRFDDLYQTVTII